MKIRKRMGLPRARMVRSRHAAKHTVPDDIFEILRDRARRTVIAEHELAAKQRRLLERASDQSQGESTPEKFVALLNRIAEVEAAFTPEQREMARNLGF